MKSRAQQILESKIRKMVREELSDSPLSSAAGYRIGDYYGDGSFCILDDDRVILRITSRKQAKQFATAVSKAADAVT